MMTNKSLIYGQGIPSIYANDSRYSRNEHSDDRNVINNHIFNRIGSKNYSDVADNDNHVDENGNHINYENKKSKHSTDNIEKNTNRLPGLVGSIRQNEIDDDWNMIKNSIFDSDENSTDTFNDNEEDDDPYAAFSSYLRSASSFKSSVTPGVDNAFNYPSLVSNPSSSTFSSAGNLTPPPGLYFPSSKLSSMASSRVSFYRHVSSSLFFSSSLNDCYRFVDVAVYHKKKKKRDIEISR